MPDVTAKLTTESKDANQPGSQTRASEAETVLRLRNARSLEEILAIVRKYAGDGPVTQEEVINRLRAAKSLEEVVTIVRLHAEIREVHDTEEKKAGRLWISCPEFMQITRKECVKRLRGATNYKEACYIVWLYGGRCLVDLFDFDDDVDFPLPSL